jgi:hypothetical protein
LSALPAEKLLGIAESEPERLFSENALAAKAEYHELVMRWHPDHDRTKLGEQVFSHIAILYHAARDRLGNGKWREPAEKIDEEEEGVLKLRSLDRSKPLKIIRYLKHVPFELGDTYISNTIVAYVLRNDFADLFESARRIISGFAYANKAMEQEVARYLPQIESTFYTTDKCVMVVRKTPDLVRLRDVVDHFGGKLDPKHVAWIQNTVHNVFCYINKYAKLTHNALSLDTYFISPKLHSGALLGGWWYALPVGAKFTTAPTRTAHYAPPDVLRGHKADIRTDLELIRALGRELLGDVSGMRLAIDKAAPTEMVNHLRLPTTGNPVRDYEIWKDKVLPACFGRRRFVEMGITPSDIYKEI